MSKIIGLIPSRLGSKRLPGKALADIEGLPVIIHTSKRAMMSKLLDKLIVCTDSDLIASKCREFDIDVVITDGDFKNGTERIASVAKNLDFRFAIDIQGDEPLVDPNHIDLVAKNIVDNVNNPEILIPTLEVPFNSSETIVRVQSSLSGRVMTLSRAHIPHRYSIPVNTVQKHLSVIGFTKSALENYSKLSPTPNECSEDIELLRALENDMRIFSLPMEGNSFSVDVQDDLIKARVAIKQDKYFQKYRTI
tara:strand:- start:294 stop:1043 length:750 start_codon:yes stop_codon:yes gene_type:complete